jgi:hypothetical protein
LRDERRVHDGRVDVGMSPKGRARQRGGRVRNGPVAAVPPYAYKEMIASPSLLGEAGTR